MTTREKRDAAGDAPAAYDPQNISIDSMLGQARLNTAQLGPNAGLVGSNILFKEDTVNGVRRRGWNERLFYGVGTSYLIGAPVFWGGASTHVRASSTQARLTTTCGGLGLLPRWAWNGTGITAGSVWGFWEGLRHPDGTTGRLRINSVLNSVTRRGPFLGNSMGVLGTGASHRAPRFVQQFL
jgi:hypothetical protein